MADEERAAPTPATNKRMRIVLERAFGMGDSVRVVLVASVATMVPETLERMRLSGERSCRLQLLKPGAVTDLEGGAPRRWFAASQLEDPRRTHSTLNVAVTTQTSGLGRFDPFAEPSANDRYLRAP